MSSGNNNSLNQLQQQQQAALTKGGQAIESQFAKTFTPGYYQGIVNAYENQNVPILNQQFQQTQQGLNYKLANQGISKSSAAQNLGSSLQQQLAQGQQQIVNNAEQAQQQQQQTVANEKSQLYGQLQVSQNPTATAQSAANIAAQTPAPSVFAPIGNAFSNWSNLYLANQTANTANQNSQLALALYAPYLNQQQGGGAIPQNYGGNS